MPFAEQSACNFVIAKNMAATLNDIRKKMQMSSFCMMTAQTGRGSFNSQPMSNNGDVEYDGNSYFFSYENSKKIKELTENAQVQLNFNGPDDLYISVSGKAKLIRTRSKMQDHWQDSLKQWFEQGLETPGIVMIHVVARTIKYWQREQEGEVKVKDSQ